MKKEKIKVLVVDDDPSLNELIKIKLNANGFETQSVYTGAGAIEYIEKNPDLLVLLDMKLSDMMSERVINELNGRGIYFSFVIMTGFGDQKIAVEMMKLGAIDYIVKDVGFVDLLPPVIIKASNQMNDRLKITESQNIIARNEEQFRNIFENIHDIYAVLSADFRIEEISPSVFDVFNVNREELIGRNISELFVLRNEWRHCYKHIQENNFIENYEVSLSYNPDIQHKYCLINAKRVLFESQQRNKIIVTIRDISQYKRLENEMISKVIQAEEKERKNIADELHDYIGPLLSTVKIYTNVLTDSNKETENRNEILANIASIIDESVKTIRNIVNSLTPTILNDYGLEKAFNSFIFRLMHVENVTIEFNCGLSQDRFGKVLETTIYRSGIELINNGLKHSFATLIRLSLIQKGERLSLTYTDNGIGFDSEIQRNPDKAKGHGLSNIVNRVKTLHGRINIKSATNKGTVVDIVFMLSNIHDV